MYPWLVFLFLPLLVVRVWLWLWWVGAALCPSVVHHSHTHTPHPVSSVWSASVWELHDTPLMSTSSDNDSGKKSFSCIHMTFSCRNGLSNILHEITGAPLASVVIIMCCIFILWPLFWCFYQQQTSYFILCSFVLNLYYILYRGKNIWDIC